MGQTDELRRARASHETEDWEERRTRRRRYTALATRRRTGKSGAPDGDGMRARGRDAVRHACGTGESPRAQLAERRASQRRNRRRRSWPAPQRRARPGPPARPPQTAPRAHSHTSAEGCSSTSAATGPCSTAVPRSRGSYCGGTCAASSSAATAANPSSPEPRWCPAAVPPVLHPRMVPAHVVTLPLYLYPVAACIACSASSGDISTRGPCACDPGYCAR